MSVNYTDPRRELADCSRNRKGDSAWIIVHVGMGVGAEVRRQAEVGVRDTGI